MREDIRDIIRDLCKWKWVTIIEGKVMPDHIHLLLSLPPKYFEVQIWKQAFLGNRVLRQHSRHPGESTEEVHTRTRETGADDG